MLPYLNKPSCGGLELNICGGSWRSGSGRRVNKEYNARHNMPSNSRRRGGSGKRVIEEYNARRNTPSN